MGPETLPHHARVAAGSHHTDSADLGTRTHATKRVRVAHLIVLIAPFLMIDFGMIFTYPFVFPQYPFFLEQVHHYSAAQYGMLFSTYGIALAVFPLVLG